MGYCPNCLYVPLYRRIAGTSRYIAGMPELSLRFHQEMARRTVIERLHKLMKDDFGDERLDKRGNDAFQARLDKTRWAMHLLLADRSRR